MGPNTDPNTVAMLWEAAEEGREHTAELALYRKDGTAFCSQVQNQHTLYAHRLRLI